MLVKHAMTLRADTIGANESVQDAARRMRALRIGALPVLRAGRLVGILTDRDIVVRGTALGSDPTTTRVRDVMTPQVVSCYDDDSLGDAARIMAERSIRRIMVLNAERKLVGVLSADDLALVARGLAADVIEHCRDPERLAEGHRPSANP